MNSHLRLNTDRTHICAVAIILVTIVMLPTTAWPQSSAVSSNAVTGGPVLSEGVLDGRRYRAGIVRAEAEQDGKTPPLGDQLMFENGEFSSAVCKRYNFAAAPYWVRTEGDKIHFLAEMTSPTDGRMLWKGTVSGDTLEGTMRWTKKRWYWTIDTEHTIRGALEKELSAVPAPSK